MSTADVNDTLRCDVWLFRIRLCKSRALAGKLIEGGAVRIDRNGQVIRLKRPAAPVRAGDRVVIQRSGTVMRLRIEHLPERRGPAPEAQASYSLENDPHVLDPD